MAKNTEMPVVKFHDAHISLREGYRIKKVDVAAVESLNRELLSTGSEIKELQDRLEDILANSEKNKTDYAAGKIEKLTFQEVQNKFYNERMEILDNLRNANRNSAAVIAKIKSLVEEHRIE